VSIIKLFFLCAPFAHRFLSARIASRSPLLPDAVGASRKAKNQLCPMLQKQASGGVFSIFLFHSKFRTKASVHEISMTSAASFSNRHRFFSVRKSRRKKALKASSTGRLSTQKYPKSSKHWSLELHSLVRLSPVIITKKRFFFNYGFWSMRFFFDPFTHRRMFSLIFCAASKPAQRVKRFAVSTMSKD